MKDSIPSVPQKFGHLLGGNWHKSKAKWLFVMWIYGDIETTLTFREGPNLPDFAGFARLKHDAAHRHSRDR
ncbi:hypothetical protein [Leptothermofonsia sp. ETS-13]|uniref:hypothetical protein n=1 Tax=Leptothermofonsia sp. ETS-13 TaxID=3035696 RepID=UPI003B9F1D5F